MPARGAWLEFDVENVETATAALEVQGYRMLAKNRKEPWAHFARYASGPRYQPRINAVLRSYYGTCRQATTTSGA